MSNKTIEFIIDPTNSRKHVSNMIDAATQRDWGVFAKQYVIMLGKNVTVGLAAAAITTGAVMLWENAKSIHWKSNTDRQTDF